MYDRQASSWQTHKSKSHHVKIHRAFPSGPSSFLCPVIHLPPPIPAHLSVSKLNAYVPLRRPHFPPLHKEKKNSTAKVFNSNFISSAAARKLTQQPLESKVTLGSPLTVLYANRPAPGQWSRPAESLLMQIWLSESILLERVRRPPTPQVIFHRIGCLRVLTERGRGGAEERGKKVGKKREGAGHSKNRGLLVWWTPLSPS